MHRDCSCHFFRLGPSALLLLTAFLECAECRAEFRVALPAVGTDINYVYGDVGGPDFVIADAAPRDDVLAARLLFADGNYFRVTNSDVELWLTVEVTLRSARILDLFDEIFIGFDESLSLLRADGSIFATSPKNVGVGFYLERRDTYSFQWDFHELPEDTVHGFEWTITPNLVPGAQLPESLGVEFYVHSSGPIVVVPEPSTAVLIISAFACVRRRR